MEVAKEKSSKWPSNRNNRKHLQKTWRCFLLFGNETFQCQVDILRAFSQPSHVISVPVLAKRDIGSERITFFCQVFLHFCPKAIEHLEFKAVQRNVLFFYKSFNFFDNMMVMRRNGCISRRLKVNFNQSQVVVINFFFMLQRDFFAFFISSFYETVTYILQIFNVLFRSV